MLNNSRKVRTIMWASGGPAPRKNASKLTKMTKMGKFGPLCRPPAARPQEKTHQNLQKLRKWGSSDHYVGLRRPGPKKKRVKIDKNYENGEVRTIM